MIDFIVCLLILILIIILTILIIKLLIKCYNKRNYIKLNGSYISNNKLNKNNINDIDIVYNIIKNKLSNNDNSIDLLNNSINYLINIFENNIDTNYIKLFNLIKYIHEYIDLHARNNINNYNLYKLENKLTLISIDYINKHNNINTFKEYIYSLIIYNEFITHEIIYKHNLVPNIYKLLNFNIIDYNYYEYTNILIISSSKLIELLYEYFEIYYEKDNNYDSNLSLCENIIIIVFKNLYNYQNYIYNINDHEYFGIYIYKISELYSSISYKYNEEIINYIYKIINNINVKFIEEDINIFEECANILTKIKDYKIINNDQFNIIKSSVNKYLDYINKNKITFVNLFTFTKNILLIEDINKDFDINIIEYIKEILDNILKIIDYDKIIYTNKYYITEDHKEAFYQDNLEDYYIAINRKENNMDYNFKKLIIYEYCNFLYKYNYYKDIDEETTDIYIKNNIDSKYLLK